MLRMKPVGKGEQGAKRAELYYEKTDSGYYQAEGGLHSEWGGKGAPKLGLEGPPDYEHFKRLIRGLDPWTGEQLTARLRDDRIPCWDVTACIPKGVTLCHRAGRYPRPADACGEAVRGVDGHAGSIRDDAGARRRQAGRPGDGQSAVVRGRASRHAAGRG